VSNGLAWPASAEVTVAEPAAEQGSPDPESAVSAPAAVAAPPAALTVTATAAAEETHRTFETRGHALPCEAESNLEYTTGRQDHSLSSQSGGRQHGAEAAAEREGEKGNKTAPECCSCR
jgi:hypothetical protein